MSEAGRAAGAGGRGLRGREPAGPVAARRRPAGGEGGKKGGRAGRAGHGSGGGRGGGGGEAAGDEAGGRAGRLCGGEEPSAAVWGRAPLELFCQPPYLWAEYFRGGEGGDCWEGLEMMGLGRNHPPGGREGGNCRGRAGTIGAEGCVHAGGSLGVGRKCSRRTGEGGPVGGRREPRR